MKPPVSYSCRNCQRLPLMGLRFGVDCKMTFGLKMNRHPLQASRDGESRRSSLSTSRRARHRFAPALLIFFLTLGLVAPMLSAGIASSSAAPRRACCRMMREGMPCQCKLKRCGLNQDGRPAAAQVAPAFPPVVIESRVAMHPPRPQHRADVFGPRRYSGLVVSPPTPPPRS